MIAISSASFVGRMIWKRSVSKHTNAIGNFFNKLDDEVPNEIRLLFLTVILYGLFMTWGYLQEKLTTTFYETNDINEPKLQWKYPLVLNLFVNIFASLTAILVQNVFQAEKPCFLPSNTDNPPTNSHPDSKELAGKARTIPFYKFWRPALSATVATSLSYISLDYISYPLMILTKSCKHIPVMLVGIIFYKKVYHWSKYVSVAFICAGICLFTAMKGNSNTNTLLNEAENEFLLSLSLLFGLFLVFVHLLLDGVTSNEQDRIFSNYSVSSLTMMQNINLWQCVYLIGYLLFEYVWKTSSSETQLSQALHMLEITPAVFRDILVFCMCACVGQILIFGLIRRFGSLVWITISVTRQLFTILLSVFLFQHQMKQMQWLGIAFVFSGMGLEIYMNYRMKNMSITKPIAEPSTLAILAAGTKKERTD